MTLFDCWRRGSDPTAALGQLTWPSFTRCDFRTARRQDRVDTVRTQIAPQMVSGGG